MSGEEKPAPEATVGVLEKNEDVLEPPEVPLWQDGLEDMGCERAGHWSRCLRRGGPGVRDLGHSSTSGLSDLFLEFGSFLWGGICQWQEHAHDPPRVCGSARSQGPHG